MITIDNIDYLHTIILYLLTANNKRAAGKHFAMSTTTAGSKAKRI